MKMKQPVLFNGLGGGCIEKTTAEQEVTVYRKGSFISAVIRFSN